MRRVRGRVRDERGCELGILATDIDTNVIYKN